jgi:hypothetical protein
MPRRMSKNPLQQIRRSLLSKLVTVHHDVSRRSGSNAQPLAILLLGLVKVALVSTHDIEALNAPHDAYWHILSAASWYWWRPFNEWTLMNPPVYPLFVAAMKITGLPLRMAIELLYIGGAATLTLSLGRLGIGPLARIVVFGLIVFHPYSYEVFDHVYAETLYTCLMLFFVTFFIQLVTAKSRIDLRRSTILFAGTTALLWYCRKESILLGGLLALIGCTIAGASLCRLMSKRDAVDFGMRLVAIPYAAVLALGMLIAGANGLRYGLWHTFWFNVPNYARAYSSLEAIRPDHAVRFVPITRDMRQKAYAVSPAFRELAPIIDGKEENWGAFFTRQSMGIHGEIGAGWFYWVLIDAAARAGHFKNAPDAEAYFGRVADEITAALNDGRLPSRRVILPFVDPDVSLWLPYIPSSLIELTEYLFSSQVPVRAVALAEVAPDVVADFDRVANRRTSASEYPSYIAQGWVLSSTPPPVAIKMVDMNGQFVRSSYQPQPRPDVPPIKNQTGQPGPPALGFTIRWPASEHGLESTRFKVLLQDGTSAISSPVSTIPLGKEIQLIAEAPSTVFIALDRLEKPTTSKTDVMAAFLIRWYYPIFAAFTLLCAVRLLSAFSNRKFSIILPLAVLLFLLAVIVSRVLLFAVLDASAWNALQARYLFPIAPLVTLIPALFLSSLPVGMSSTVASCDKALPGRTHVQL